MSHSRKEAWSAKMDGILQDVAGGHVFRETEAMAERRLGRYFFKFSGAMFLCSQTVADLAGADRNGNGSCGTRRPSDGGLRGGEGAQEREGSGEANCGDDAGCDEAPPPSPLLTYEDVTWAYSTPKVLTKGMDYCWGHKAIGQGFKDFHGGEPHMTLLAAEGAFKAKLGSKLRYGGARGFDSCWRDVLPFFRKSHETFLAEEVVGARADAHRCRPLETPHVTPDGERCHNAATSTGGGKEQLHREGDRIAPRSESGEPSARAPPTVVTAPRERAQALLPFLEESAPPPPPPPLSTATPEALALLFKESVAFLRGVSGSVDDLGVPLDQPSADAEAAKCSRERCEEGWVPALGLVRVLYGKIDATRKMKVCAQQRLMQTTATVAEDKEEPGDVEQAALAVLRGLYWLDPRQGWGLACFLIHMNVLGKIQCCAVPLTTPPAADKADDGALPPALVRASWLHHEPRVTARVEGSRPPFIFPLERGGEGEEEGRRAGMEARPASAPVPKLFDFVESKKAWLKEVRVKGGRLCPDFRPFLILYPDEVVQHALDRVCGIDQEAARSVAELTSQLEQQGVPAGAARDVGVVYTRLLTTGSRRLCPTAAGEADVGAAALEESKREGTGWDRVWGPAVALAHNMQPYCPVTPSTPPPPTSAPPLQEASSTPLLPEQKRKKTKVPDHSCFLEVREALAARFLTGDAASLTAPPSPRAVVSVTTAVAGSVQTMRSVAGRVVAVVIASAALTAAVPAMAEAVPPPATVVPPHLLYAYTPGKGVAERPQFRLPALFFSPADVGADAAPAAADGERGDLVHVHPRLTRQCGWVDVTLPKKLVEAAVLCDARATGGPPPAPPPEALTERPEGAAAAPVEDVAPSADLAHQAAPVGGVALLPTVPVVAAGTVATAEAALDAMRARRCRAVQEALAAYMAKPGGGDEILAAMISAATDSDAIAWGEEAFTADDRITALLGRFTQEVEEVRQAALAPVTLLRHANPVEAAAVPLGNTTAVARGAGDADRPDSSTHAKCDAADPARAAQGGSCGQGSIAEGGSFWVAGPHGSRKLLAALRRGFLASRWLPEGLEMITAVPSNGSGLRVVKELPYEVHLRSAATVHETAAAIAAFESCLLFIVEGEGNGRSASPSAPTPAATRVLDLWRCPLSGAPAPGCPEDCPADFHALAQERRDVIAGGGEGNGGERGECQVVRKASMLGWPLVRVWDPQILVDMFLYPPLAACLDTFATAAPRDSRGLSLDIALMKRDLQSLLLRVFYDETTRERLEFLGDSFVDFLCAKEVLTAVDTTTQKLLWRGGLITSSTRNSVLVEELPICVRETILAVCGGVAKEKTYSDFVEALFGTLVATLWVMPLVRARSSPTRTDAARDAVSSCPLPRHASQRSPRAKAALAFHGGREDPLPSFSLLAAAGSWLQSILHVTFAQACQDQ